MATAAEVLVPLRPGLVPVPAAGQPGVCRICHSSCEPQYAQCFPCLEAVQTLQASEILPISMSIDGELLHHHLRGYKDGPSPQACVRMSLRLASLVAVFLENHRQCIGEFNSVVSVPSARGAVVEGIIDRARSLRDQYRPALEVTGLGSKQGLRADRFRLTRSVDGERVLVLDDTFTRGPTLFSAVAALRDGGAVIVGPVVLGRHIRPDFAPSAVLLSWLQKRPWDDTRCCWCDGERANIGQML